MFYLSAKKEKGKRGGNELMNLCFSCEKLTQEDNALKGKYICLNQRCSRVGLLSTFVLIPPKIQGLKKEENSKNISKSDDLIHAKEV